jgi:hypothetical protein
MPLPRVKQPLRKLIVSPLSNKVQLALSNTTVGLIANGRRLTARIDNTDRNDHIDALIEALIRLIAEAGAVGKSARVVFSHSLASVWQCPAPPVRLNNAELTGWVQDQSIEKFGESAADWQLAWDQPPPGTPIWVTGIQRALMERLTSKLKEKGLTLQSAEPWLSVAAFNYRKQLSTKNSWLALAEPGRITLAGFKGGEPNLLRSVSFNPEQDTAVAALGNMLAREALLSPEFKAAQIWIRSFGLATNWQELTTSHDLEVRASLVPDLDITEILEH